MPRFEVIRADPGCEVDVIEHGAGSVVRSSNRASTLDAPGGVTPSMEKTCGESWRTTGLSWANGAGRESVGALRKHSPGSDRMFCPSGGLNTPPRQDRRRPESAPS